MFSTRKYFSKMVALPTGSHMENIRDEIRLDCDPEQMGVATAERVL